MKFIVENLGIIHSASLDLRRPLVVLCGPNSTGKTYLSYVVNFVLSDDPIIDVPAFKQLAHHSKTGDAFILDKKIMDVYLKGLSEYVNNNLDVVFGISKEESKRLFGGSRITLALDEEDYARIKATPLTMQLQLRAVSAKHMYQLSKAADSSEVRINFFTDGVAIKSEMTEDVSNLLMQRFFHFAVFAPFTHSHMFTVERNSIYTFKSELAQNRTELVNKILDSSTGATAKEIVEQQAKRYPWAVRTSLNEANGISAIKKDESAYASVARRIENDLLHGEVSADKDGEVSFKVKGNGQLPFQITSSIVKTLSSLIFYLKYQANKGDVIIIDEPEMNFHPDNQILLARLFAILANSGLGVVISTHSDYIIREINNLVMAETLQQKEPGFSVETVYGYAKDELLNSANVAAYYFNMNKDGKVGVEALKVTQYGFDVQSINAAIEAQNSVTNELYDRLTYEITDDGDE